MTEQRRRLVVTSDELPAVAASPPGGYPAVAAGPQPLPPVAGVPAALPVARSIGFWRTTLGTSLVGALVAVIPAWLLSEPVSHISSGSLVVRTALWTGVFGALFGGIYSGWEDASTGVWEKAARSGGIGLLLGAISGAASGAIAQVLFTHIVKNLLQNAQSLQDLLNVYNGLDFYLARALAWALFGLGIGLASGAAKRSGQKAVNGLAGGAVGGALGGLVFHWVSTLSGVSGGVSRLLGLAAVAVAIGVAVGLVELARRQAWLRVIAGGMAGKEFIVYHQQTNLGASPKCQITLIKDPAIQPLHATITEQGPRRLLSSQPGAPTFVNGSAVSQHWLRSGDTIQLGASALQYTEREAMR